MLSKTEKNELNLQSQPIFLSLQGKDVITAGVSDHHPIIHDHVLFWNIMMQGKKRGTGIGFNNGFGLIESNTQYKHRLARVAVVIAETVYRYPDIEAIHLCEGPVQSEHLSVLYKALMKYPFMKRFMRENKFFKPDAEGIQWGLLTLIDTRYQVAAVNSGQVDQFPKLTNRFQLLKLVGEDNEKYMALAHFPFAGDEQTMEKQELSLSGQGYCRFISTLLDHYSHTNLIFCADFNLNPYLINQWNDRVLDKIPNHNSILLTVDEAFALRQIDTVTVDGILLSNKEKQTYHAKQVMMDLVNTAKSEYRFFQPRLANDSSDQKSQENKDEKPLVKK